MSVRVRFPVGSRHWFAERFAGRRVEWAMRTGVVVFVGLACVGCLRSGAAGSGGDVNRAGIVEPMVSQPLVRLKRTGCYGWCSEYEVAIDSQGRVTYEGGKHVMTQGTVTEQLSAERLRGLREAVVRSWGVEMPRGECALGCCSSDSPDVVITTWGTGVPRTVVYERGCEKTPAALQALELEIDRVVDIERWIGTDAARRACFVDKNDCSSFVGIE